ncbi:NADH pyrophosphatase [Gracilaria domingensis]|nr:NADH pyrophosphatase [Gracilaria domingensis]
MLSFTSNFVNVIFANSVGCESRSVRESRWIPICTARPHSQPDHQGGPSLEKWSQPKNFFLNTELQRPDFRGFSCDFGTLMRSVDESYLFLPVWNDRVIIEDHRAVLWTASQLHDFVLKTNNYSEEARPLLVHLCRVNEPLTQYIAVDASLAESPPLMEGQRAFPIRRALSFVSETDATVLAHAKSLIDWHASAKFCSRCGSVTALTHGGNARFCRNSECSTRNIYPRVMPSVITLVVRTDTNEILLGRKASWPKNRYSLIAGYAEIFESLEQTVVREVREETGVIVDEKSVEYHSSQPWPSLPHASLMAAFRAYVHEEQHAHIAVDTNELEDARWFDRHTLKELLDADGGITIPGHTSVARRLISDWLTDSDETTI